MQNSKVDFVINKMPVFGNVHELDNLVRNFKLKEGYAAETSGGLMIVMEEDIVEEFMYNLKSNYGIESWEIGEVKEGNNQTIIREDVEFIEVTEKSK